MSSVLHIPCKLASRRCPQKNVADVGGIPAVVRVLHSAIGSGRFDRIVVSTDEPEHLRSIIPYEIEIVPQTPSTVIQTTHDALTSDDYDARVTIMLPTAVMIDSQDVSDVLDLSEQTRDPVMTVIRLPHRIGEMLKLSRSGEFLNLPFRFKNDEGGFFLDAAGLYTFPPGRFEGVQDMYVPRMRPFVLPRWKGVDVDEPEDLEMVRRVFDGAARD